jgi:hypothetical protein
VKDGTETDVDCGGLCPPCADGKMCKVDNDCTSMGCDALSLTCVANPCTDHQKDGTETDVDCGGGTCPTCADGKHCMVNSDCTSMACDAVSFTCDASQCMDGKPDGNETDVDCGGGQCPQCAIGKKCLGDTDCVSPSACDANSLTCVGNQCADHRKDGNETDVDCGGTDACARCPTGKACMVNSDCQSGHTCNGVTHTCS